jgi:hypothetical protein
MPPKLLIPRFDLRSAGWEMMRIRVEAGGSAAINAARTIALAALDVHPDKPQVTHGTRPPLKPAGVPYQV